MGVANVFSSSAKNLYVLKGGFPKLLGACCGGEGRLDMSAPSFWSKRGVTGTGGVLFGSSAASGGGGGGGGGGGSTVGVEFEAFGGGGGGGGEEDVWV